MHISTCTCEIGPLRHEEIGQHEGSRSGLRWFRWKLKQKLLVKSAVRQFFPRCLNLCRHSYLARYIV